MARPMNPPEGGRSALSAFSRTNTCAKLCLVLSLLAPVPASAQSPDPETELIVLLRAGGGHPTPEEVVESFGEGRVAVPGGLDVGGPIDARFAITRRARDEIREWNLANPDTSPARLQRYVVFTYPDTSTRNSTRSQQLEQNEHVEHVEDNVVFTLSSTTRSLATRSGSTSDPLTDPVVSGDGHQWHVPLLRLPEAWEYVRGHALIASVDPGVQADHPDLRPFRRDVTGRLVYEGGNYRDHLSEDVPVRRAGRSGTTAPREIPPLRIASARAETIRASNAALISNPSRISSRPPRV